MPNFEKDLLDNAQNFYAALNANDINALRSLLSDDAGFIYPISLPYGCETWKGFEKIKESITIMFTHLGFTKWEVKELHVHANNVWCSGMFRIGPFGILYSDLLVFDMQGQRLKQRTHFIDTALILNCFTENFID